MACTPIEKYRWCERFKSTDDQQLDPSVTSEFYELMRQTTCQRGIVFSLLMTWYGLQTHKDFFEKQRQIRVLKKISLTVKIVKNISFFDRTPRMQTRNDGRKNKIEEKTTGGISDTSMTFEFLSTTSCQKQHTAYHVLSDSQNFK